MSTQTYYLLAADALLFLHVLFVAFVIVGLLMIFVGKALNWHWVRNRTLRLSHLAAIVVVVLQSWFGVICPLTNWEMALREKAGDATYAGTFMSHWLDAILYYQAPPWVFAVCYTMFGSLILASWFLVPPNRSKP